jgi:hypothetical protein
MGSSVHIGLAVTSHNVGATCQAVFSNVTTTGNVSGQWVNQDVGIANNDPEQLYMALEDSAGRVGVVNHPDGPASSQNGDWTLWAADLADFADQGVNLSGIKKIMLGLGDRANPVAGGAGTMYFDDIAVGNPVQSETLGLNVLVNGDFETGVQDPWNLYGPATAIVVQDIVDADVPEPVIEGANCLFIEVPAATANFWDIGLQPVGEIFEKGKKYTVSAFFKTKSGTLDINFKPELAVDPWTGYNDEMITINDQWASTT